LIETDVLPLNQATTYNVVAQFNYSAIKLMSK